MAETLETVVALVEDLVARRALATTSLAAARADVELVAAYAACTSALEAAAVEAVARADADAASWGGLPSLTEPSAARAAAALAALQAHRDAGVPAGTDEAVATATAALAAVDGELVAARKLRKKLRARELKRTRAAAKAQEKAAAGAEEDGDDADENARSADDEDEEKVSSAGGVEQASSAEDDADGAEDDDTSDAAPAKRARTSAAPSSRRSVGGKSLPVVEALRRSAVREASDGDEDEDAASEASDSSTARSRTRCQTCTQFGHTCTSCPDYTGPVEGARSWANRVRARRNRRAVAARREATRLRALAAEAASVEYAERVAAASSSPSLMAPASPHATRATRCPQPSSPVAAPTGVNPNYRAFAVAPSRPASAKPASPRASSSSSAKPASPRASSSSAAARASPRASLAARASSPMSRPRPPNGVPHSYTGGKRPRAEIEKLAEREECIDEIAVRLDNLVTRAIALQTTGAELITIADAYSRMHPTSALARSMLYGDDGDMGAFYEDDDEDEDEDEDESEDEDDADNEADPEVEDATLQPEARETALARSSAARLIGAEAARHAPVLRVADASAESALARADLPRDVLAVDANALAAIAAADGPVLVASYAPEPSASDRRQLDAHEGVLPAGSAASTLAATCALHDVPLLVPWARVRRKRGRAEEHAGGDIDLAAYEAADEAEAVADDAENEYDDDDDDDEDESGDDFNAPAEPLPLAQLALANFAGIVPEEAARDARGRVPRLEAMDTLERANPIPAFDGHVVLHQAAHKYEVDGVLGVYRSTTEQVHRFFAEFDGASAAHTTLTGANWRRKPEHAAVMATVLAAWADDGLLAASPQAEAAAHAFVRGQLTYGALLGSEHASVRALVPVYLAVGAEALRLAWAENGRSASAAGVDMHECIEFFYRGVYTRGDIEALAATSHPELVQFLAFHDAEIAGKYAPYRMELLMHDPELLTCGALDGLFINLRTGALRDIDWKRTKELKYRAYMGARGTGPFASVPDTNYWHYVIQQNVYRYYLRRYAGLELEDGMALAIFHPEHERYELVEMPVRDDLIEAWRAAMLAANVADAADAVAAAEAAADAAAGAVDAAADAVDAAAATH